MIKFDLHTIDWNAISAMATTLAFVVAFFSIWHTNKKEKENRNFQLLIGKKEEEFKNLDEFCSKILKIYSAINPIDILNYSEKFIENRFTETDKNIVEQNAANDEINCVKLNILLLKTNNETANDLIKKLGNIREIYGHWARRINLIYKSIDKLDVPEFREQTKNIVTQMADICCGYNPKYIPYIQNIYGQISDLKEQSIRILECFETETSMQLQNARKDFEQHLYPSLLIGQI